MTIILAVDPGWSPAWALGDEDRLISYGRPRHTGAMERRYDVYTERVDTIIDSVMSTLLVDIVLIEGQYVQVHKGKAVNAPLQLARTAQIWAQSARYAGVERVIDEVPPASRQSILRAGRIPRRSTLKLASMHIAHSFIDKFKPSHMIPGGVRDRLNGDEADAICMWSWMVGEVRRERIEAKQLGLFGDAP